MRRCDDEVADRHTGTQNIRGPYRGAVRVGDEDHAISVQAWQGIFRCVLVVLQAGREANADQTCY
ncbi:hypothetical protein BIU82_13920 [Arthrobacter sp. SW1]|nr:hypothetical protein BIU82_13920 [Arthrobacter sp. SW1]